MMKRFPREQSSPKLPQTWESVEKDPTCMYRYEETREGNKKDKSPKLNRRLHSPCWLSANVFVPQFDVVSVSLPATFYLKFYYLYAKPELLFPLDQEGSPYPTIKVEAVEFPVDALDALLEHEVERVEYNDLEEHEIFTWRFNSEDQIATVGGVLSVIPVNIVRLFDNEIVREHKLSEVLLKYNTQTRYVLVQLLVTVSVTWDSTNFVWLFPYDHHLIPFKLATRGQKKQSDEYKWKVGWEVLEFPLECLGVGDSSADDYEIAQMAVRVLPQKLYQEDAYMFSLNEAQPPVLGLYHVKRPQVWKSKGVVFVFHVQNTAIYYLYSYTFPIFLIVTITVVSTYYQVTNYIKEDSDIVSLPLNAIVAIISVKFIMELALPKIQDPTLGDAYIAISFAYVALCILIQYFAAETYTGLPETITLLSGAPFDQPSSVIIFGAVWLIFHVFIVVFTLMYWLCGSSFVLGRATKGLERDLQDDQFKVYDTVHVVKKAKRAKHGVGGIITSTIES